MTDNTDQKVSSSLVEIKSGIKGRNNIITWVELDRHILNIYKERKPFFPVPAGGYARLGLEKMKT